MMIVIRWNNYRYIRMYYFTGYTNIALQASLLPVLIRLLMQEEVPIHSDTYLAQNSTLL